MSDQQLRRMLNLASECCDQAFARKGEVKPVWHAVCADGRQFCQPHPIELGRDLAAAFMRAEFEWLEVVRCVYIGEAWSVDIKGDDTEMAVAAAQRGDLFKYPGRIEVVVLQGEDRDAGMISGHRRIVRPAGKKPYLGALEIVIEPGGSVMSSGRLVGMLPVRGRPQ